MLKGFVAFCAALFLLSASAQEIDVQHYSFSIGLSDSTDRIVGEAQVRLLLKSGSEIALDLAQRKSGGKGMTVSKVTGPHVAGWEQRSDRIVIRLDETAVAPAEYAVNISYSGVPADGLIISKNKWGERTFFADNWPNRAHQWIPCNDRPDDKASFEFRVDAPRQYFVISNGTAGPDPMNEDAEKYEEGGHHFYYREPTPLSTKVMVIGVAPFAVKTFADGPPGIPVSAWVFRQDSTKGFYDYAPAPSILKFFSDYIAPFPYEKLANVQSKTIFGGMENASAIFYAEESVTGDRKWEDVLAHEIAHQWFGDMVSEKSFAHLWLSEGFATYFTNVYIGQKYGVDSMRKRLAADRRQVIAFAQRSSHPVVDSTTDLMSLLNANSYQKGGWVLHMLRNEVGDSVFRKIIQAYYNDYKGSNADTKDFIRVADSTDRAHFDLVRQARRYNTPVVGDPWPRRSLAALLEQWLYRPGVPELTLTRAAGSGREANFTLRQEGVLYSFPLEIETTNGSGRKELHAFWIKDRETMLRLGPVEGRQWSYRLDPDVKLLFKSAAGQKTGSFVR